MASTASQNSMKTVLSALLGNLFVTIIKVIAYVASGSAAMLSEAIHSLADTGNQLLLFLGLRRSTRESDDDFQYGYGGERFIFGILSASGIFFIGCGVTLYHGIQGLFDPHPSEAGWLTFLILGVSALIEGSVLFLAVRGVMQVKGEMPFFRYVRERADPATLAILFEDAVAVFGLFAAALGIVLTKLTGNPLYDTSASIVVGLMLGYVAVHLVLENRRLLLGESVPEGVEEKFIEIVDRSDMVLKVHDVKTLQLTPEVYKFKAQLTIDGYYIAERLDPIMPKFSAGFIRERSQLLEKLSLTAVQVISEEIQAIERAIKKEIPEARYIDLELDQNPRMSKPAPKIQEEDESE